MTMPLRTIILPEFLVPAFARTTRSQSRQFSQSISSQSRIGAAALSIPQDVQLTLLDLPQGKAATPTRIERPRTIQVKGPLGRFSREFASEDQSDQNYRNSYCFYPSIRAVHARHPNEKSKSRNTR